jgi:hypothetical protein
MSLAFGLATEFNSTLGGLFNDLVRSNCSS